MSGEKKSLERGIALFKKGDLERAVLVLEEATKEYPDSYEAFVYLGASYAQLARYNLSIGALKKACEIKPDSARVHYNLGQAYEAAGVPREAWTEYKKALEIDANYGLARGALISLSQRLPKLLGSHIEVAA